MLLTKSLSGEYSRFGVNSFKNQLRKDMHILKKSLSLVQAGRGIYRSVEPEKWIGMAGFLTRMLLLRGTPYNDVMLEEFSDFTGQ